jgi:hypothetical protein
VRGDVAVRGNVAVRGDVAVRGSKRCGKGFHNANGHSPGDA